MSPVEVLTNPDGFFGRAGDDPALSKPLGVVLLAGLFGALASVPVFQAVQSALPAESSGVASFMLVGGFVGGLLGTVIVWVVMAAIFMVISSVAFEGSGDFSTLLAYVGWGFIPAVLNSAIGAAVSFYAFRDVTIPTVENPQQMQTVVQNLRSDPLFMMAGVVGIAFVVWQAFIWTYAVRYARDVTLKEAAITVAIPTLVWIAWQAYNLV